MTARRRARGLWVRRAIAAVAVAIILWLVWEAATWPDVRALASRPPTTTAFIERYKARERAAGRTPHVEWRWVSAGAIAVPLKRAVLVAEDIDFFNHHGFAPKAMREAMTQALEERRPPRGAWIAPSFRGGCCNDPAARAQRSRRWLHLRPGRPRLRSDLQGDGAGELRP